MQRYLTRLCFSGQKTAILLLFFAFAGRAQNNNLKTLSSPEARSTAENIHAALQGTTTGRTIFERYTQSDGLQNNAIYRILIAKNGFVWIATGGGIARFDGYNFKFYKNSNLDLNSLSADLVFFLWEDDEEMLWIGSMNGLNKFDPKTETFTHFYHDPNDPESLSYNWISGLSGDHNGNVWVSTKKG